MYCYSCGQTAQNCECHTRFTQREAAWRKYHKAINDVQFSPDTPIGELVMARAVLEKELKLIKILIRNNASSI